ncbi:MAG: SDR family NAD(P)-dependent oxidoreductase [Enhygromyxa sp.]
MSRTIIICGHGPGISDALARKFSREGHRVALVARSRDKLEAAAAALTQAGATARALPCDLGDPEAVERMIADARAALGPIHTIHWNAYAALAGDLLTCDLADLRKTFDVGVTGLVAAVQAALPDLRSSAGAVLITGGGFALYSDKVDQMVVNYNSMGLAVTKAAQHKLTGLLHHKLAPEGIYVGSVVVLGQVKGTAFAKDQGLEPDDIAEAFWRLASERSAVSVNFSG